MRISDWIQTCALPISWRASRAPSSSARCSMRPDMAPASMAKDNGANDGLRLADLLRADAAFLAEHMLEPATMQAAYTASLETLAGRRGPADLAALAEEIGRAHV